MNIIPTFQSPHYFSQWLLVKSIISVLPRSVKIRIHFLHFNPYHAFFTNGLFRRSQNTVCTFFIHYPHRTIYQRCQHLIPTLYCCNIKLSSQCRNIHSIHTNNKWTFRIFCHIEISLSFQKNSTFTVTKSNRKTQLSLCI